MIDICICVKRDHHSFVCLSQLFLFFLHKMLVKSWLKMFFFSYIYILWFHINSSKRFSQARVQFCFCCLGCTVIAPRSRNALFFFSRGDGGAYFGGVEFSYGPSPWVRMRPLPPAGSPSPCCYVESWLTAFPPFMVGVPELFLERCLSSISCSDGSLYIQTVVEM